MDLKMWILVPFLAMASCDPKTNLKAVVGSSMTFPDPIKERGFFNFGPKTIASVSNGDLEIEENIYRDRLTRSSSGHFTLSHLQQSDSGVYGINSKKGAVFTRFYELKLFEPVPAPVVTCVNISSDSLSLLCSGAKDNQTSLSWFRGEQPVGSSRSGELPLTVQRQDKDTSEFKCVAENPAENKTHIVNTSTICKTNETSSTKDSSKPQTYVYIIIPVVLLVLLVGLGLCFMKKCSKKNSASFQAQDSVTYAQIDHSRRKNSQSEDPSGSSARPELNSVYDQVQTNRMEPPEAQP